MLMGTSVRLRAWEREMSPLFQMACNQAFGDDHNRETFEARETRSYESESVHEETGETLPTSSYNIAVHSLVCNEHWSCSARSVAATIRDNGARRGSSRRAHGESTAVVAT